MLNVRQNCWPDDDNPSERYLYVSGDSIRFDETRIEIMEEGVYADDADIIFETKEELEQWVRVLREAWRIKAKQDKKGWRKRE